MILSYVFSLHDSEKLVKSFAGQLITRQKPQPEIPLLLNWVFYYLNYLAIELKVLLKPL
jgi:hypothetical protein